MFETLTAFVSASPWLAFATVILSALSVIAATVREQAVATMLLLDCVFLILVLAAYRDMSAMYAALIPLAVMTLCSLALCVPHLLRRAI